MPGKQKAATQPDIIDVLKAAPKSTVEEVALAFGVARSTAQKRLAAAIIEGTVQRHAEGREGRRKLPDRYTAIETPKAGDGPDPQAGSGTGPQESGSTRLRPGELDGLVLAYIDERAEQAPFGPTSVVVDPDEDDEEDSDSVAG